MNSYGAAGSDANVEDSLIPFMAAMKRGTTANLPLPSVSVDSRTALYGVIGNGNIFSFEDYMSPPDYNRFRRILVEAKAYTQD